MWLVGSTDVDNFCSDIYNLLTGVTTASNRGSGQTGNGAMAGADAWEAVDEQAYIIRSPASYPDTPFRLPIYCWRGMPRFASSVAASPNNDANYDYQKGRPTFIGTYVGATERVFFYCYVTTKNTTAGDLTGLVVTWYLYSATQADTSIANGTLSGWSGNTGIKSLRDGISLSLTLQPTDVLTATNKVLWLRGYSTTSPQGVDFIPEFISATGAGVTIGITSTDINRFVLNTDYKIVEEIDVAGVNVNRLPAEQYGWGGPGILIGIEWQDGANPVGVGSTYWVIGADLYGTYAKIATAAISYGSRFFAGLLPMCGFDTSRKTMSGVMTFGGNNLLNGYTNYGMHSPVGHLLFNTVSPAGNLYINYWISIKPTKIVMVLQGDPANSGATINFHTLQRCNDFYNGTQSYWRWIKAGNGKYYCTCGAKQPTTYMRDYNYWGCPSRVSFATSSDSILWGHYLTPANEGVIGSTYGMKYYTQNLLNPDTFINKWCIYPIIAYGSLYGKDESNSVYVFNRNSHFIGTMQDIYSISPNNWSSLDEIYDGVNTYLVLFTNVDQYSFDIYYAILEN